LAHRYSFPPLLSAGRLVEFTIMDVHPLGEENNKWSLAELELVRSDDLGSDSVWHTRTHLGRVLQPGDLALGYDLRNAAFNPGDTPGMEKYGELPDCIVVKKFYPNRGKSKRAWKLRQMQKSEEEDTGGRQPTAKQAAQAAEAAAMDYENFLQDLEEDKEMRDQIDLFKDPEYEPPAPVQDDEVDEQDEAPTVGLDELIDGLNDLAMAEDPANMFGALGDMVDDVDDSDL
jgi:nonsense-mediated mRNA decay protein 3